MLTRFGLYKEALAELRHRATTIRRYRPQPSAAGLVLEVGGGQHPHPRADVVVDKYVVDDFERARGEQLNLSRPLVVADGEQLPFADDVFSYSIASHVLEHARDPARFACELSRVSAAGYVQVPSREAELSFGWPFHPWLIDLDAGALVFEPRGDRRAMAGDALHRLYATSPLFRLAFGAHEGVWHHTVHWAGRLPVRVLGTSEAEQTAAVDVERTLHALTAAAADGRIVPLPPHLLARLVDPETRRPLSPENAHLVERESGVRYPITGGVPVLLADAAAR
jgi:uncharacterized protein YbaR (Trm112 family)